jgi:hypothetical protein
VDLAHRQAEPGTGSFEQQFIPSRPLARGGVQNLPGGVMSQASSHRSTTAVAADFRDHLIIDRYDAAFAGLQAPQLKRLRSAGSEDAVTWNVFRSLRQVDPTVWLPELFRFAFPEHESPAASHAAVSLWHSIAAPPALALGGDDATAEIDVVLESPEWVWFIDARFHGDAGKSATSRPDRDQVLRHLDVGSYYAGARRFYFSVLVLEAGRESRGAQIVAEYASLEKPRQLLRAHRPDKLQNLAGISLLAWSQVADVLRDASESASRDHEKEYAVRALEWLESRSAISSAISSAA